MDRLVEYEVRLSFLFTMGAGIFETLDRLTDLTSADFDVWGSPG
jgi:hypothetical protein